jgi:uncharacterized protein (TIGR00730 family)
MKNIAVFCASGKQYIEPFGHLVKELVRYCKKENIGVIYGGAKVGLMGLLADECIEERVPIIGIIPQGILDKELHHEGIEQLTITKTMYERKNGMYELSDAFVVLPGSLGTLDELFEVLCLSKLHIHDKAIGILNFQQFYDSIFAHFDKMIEQGFMDADVKKYFVVDNDIESLLNKMKSWERPKQSDLDKAVKLNNSAAPL